MNQVEKKQVNRFKLLKTLYDESDGNANRTFSARELGESIGLDAKESQEASRYLEGEGLLEIVAMGGIIRILHKGIKHVEHAISNPDKRTQYFPPLNLIYVENMHGSQIVQGSTNTTIANQITETNIAELKELLGELRTLKGELGLNEMLSSEYVAECDTLEAQLNSPKPKPAIMRECLSSVRSIIEGTAGSVLGSPVYQALSQALSSL